MPKAVTNIEIKVLNYLVYNAIKQIPHRDVNWSFIENKSLRGSLPMWKNAYSSIKAQLKINPNDTDGFSIVPTWVRVAYQKYRTSDIHDMWSPIGISLESLANMKEDPAPKKQTTQGERLVYQKNDELTLHIMPDNCSEEYLKGYLDAVGAKKVFKINLEEINLV